MHAPRPTPRNAAGPARLLGWLTRLAFALVVVAGVLATVGGARVEGEGDLVLEESGEDGESIEGQTVEASVTRQPHTGAPGERVEGLFAPRSLGPTVAAPVPQRWLRPRRIPPPDDDVQA